MDEVKGDYLKGCGCVLVLGIVGIYLLGIEQVVWGSVAVGLALLLFLLIGVSAYLRTKEGLW